MQKKRIQNKRMQKSKPTLYVKTRNAAHFGEIIHACIRNLKKSNINVKQDYFSKRSKFGYHMRFPSISFQEEKPLGFICA